MVNGDIKLDNVFMKAGLIKMGDFGFSGPNGIKSGFSGTHIYAAPE